ncbi:MAG: amidohydrolase [Paenibacillus sp.]|nr:amidohydrolase [Paenibacillus sp.]
MKWLDAHCHVGKGLMNGIDVQELLDGMDRANISKAVIVPWDQAIAVDNSVGNSFTLALTKQYPDRFDAFCVVNPWYGSKALDELDRAAAAGMKGLKLHPVYQGYQLTDPFILPVIERAISYRMPVYVATGTPVSSLPMQLSHVADLFPEGKFIQGHFGFPDFWIDAVPSVLKSPNIYIDTAYNMISSIEDAVKLFGAERVIFSSDAPYLSMEHEMSKFMSLELTEDERRLIGFDNMNALLEGVYI